MINLIGNELKKIFHKKSIYITLLVTLGFVILSNVIYNLDIESFYDMSFEIKFYEEEMKTLDLNNEADARMYAQYASDIEEIKLTKKYGDHTTWQAAVINREGQNYINQMMHYKYVEKDEQAYNVAKTEYNEFVKKLDSGDWRYFVNQELARVQENLQNSTKMKNEASNKEEIAQIDNEIERLNVSKQVLNWRLEKEIPYGIDYKNQCLNAYEEANNSILSLKDTDFNKLSDKEKYEIKKQQYEAQERAATSKYDIEHNTETNKPNTAKNILLTTFTEYNIFITIMAVMIAGTIVSEEFNKGTVKLLLIKPYKRVTILTAKFITTIIMLIMVMIIVVLMQFVVGGIAHGFESYTEPAVVFNHETNQIEEISILKYLVMQGIGIFPKYLLLMTLAFACSTILVNSALSITIALLGSMGAPIVNMLAQNYNLTWIKFFVTPNWDLTQYFFGKLPEFQGITFWFSFAIIVVYMIIMLVPSYIVFKKKNIKNI